ncbi:MAG: hypothetical protein PHY93_18105, partial [Bacteriovorax sp.]|nr:hypothetical protein [Bacteriovorax sp.]
MKKLLILALFSTNLLAAERVLISDSKVTDVELNRTSVRCSRFGYGVSELKIAIKGLDGWTIFDHSNINAGDLAKDPCMTAGACERFVDKKMSVDDILSGGERTEQITVNRQIVELKEVTKNESGIEVCSRHIEERLQTSVNRGDANGKIQ